MRFFSNDARETSDDEAKIDEATTDEHPERVQSDPVVVPQQRSSSASPWAASPGTVPDNPSDDADRDPSDDAVHSPSDEAVRDSSDGTLRGTDTDRDVAADTDQDVAADTNRDVAADRDPTDHAVDADGRDHDTDADGSSSRVEDRQVDDGPPGMDTGERPPFHEPAAQPTAFGAATVGGAVAASAHANPQDDDPDHSTPSSPGATVASPTEANTKSWSSSSDQQDTTADGTTDRTTADDATGDDTLNGAEPEDRIASHRSDDTDTPTVDDLPLDDRGTFDDPVAVDADGSTVTDESDSDDTTGSAADDVVAAAVPPKEQLPGAVAAPELGPLFADADAHAFRDRWRDVQLRFVDDPKVAADDAATLVDDAVEALAASLRSQKEQLTEAGATTPGDTEQLRVRLRAYRDFLDRILGL